MGKDKEASCVCLYLYYTNSLLHCNEEIINLVAVSCNKSTDSATENGMCTMDMLNDMVRCDSTGDDSEPEAESADAINSNKSNDGGLCNNKTVVSDSDQDDDDLAAKIGTEQEQATEARAETDKADNQENANANNDTENDHHDNEMTMDECEHEDHDSDDSYHLTDLDLTSSTLLRPMSSVQALVNVNTIGNFENPPSPGTGTMDFPKTATEMELARVRETRNPEFPEANPQCQTEVEPDLGTYAGTGTDTDGEEDEFPFQDEDLWESRSFATTTTTDPVVVATHSTSTATKTGIREAETQTETHVTQEEVPKDSEAAMTTAMTAIAEEDNLEALLEESRKITEKGKHLVPIKGRPGKVKCLACGATSGQKGYHQYCAALKLGLPTKYRCEVSGCGKSYKASSQLSYHQIRRHTDERLPCVVCGSTFVTQPKLTRHVRCVHQGLKPFGCDVCGKHFSSNSARNNHLEAVNCGDGTDRERTIPCPKCGKMFKTHRNMRRHRLYNHDDNGGRGKKPLVCLFCSKSFSTTLALSCHKKTTHIKERPFACEYEYCARKFSSHRDLRRHEYTHLGIKPYKCGICTKDYTRKDLAQRHVVDVHRVPENKRNEFISTKVTSECAGETNLLIRDRDVAVAYDASNNNSDGRPTRSCKAKATQQSEATPVINGDDSDGAPAPTVDLENSSSSKTAITTAGVNNGEIQMRGVRRRDRANRGDNDGKGGSQRFRSRNKDMKQKKSGQEMVEKSTRKRSASATTTTPSPDITTGYKKRKILTNDVQSYEIVAEVMEQMLDDTEATATAPPKVIETPNDQTLAEVEVQQPEPEVTNNGNNDNVGESARGEKDNRKRKHTPVLGPVNTRAPNKHKIRQVYLHLRSHSQRLRSLRSWNHLQNSAERSSSSIEQRRRNQTQKQASNKNKNNVSPNLTMRRRIRKQKQAHADAVIKVLSPINLTTPPHRRQALALTFTPVGVRADPVCSPRIAAADEDEPDKLLLRYMGPLPLYPCPLGIRAPL